MKSINEQPSEHSIYVWNILGSMTNALLSVVILMLVTRTLDGGKSDVFSIAWSISQLMATIGTYQIRTYQATDVTEVFKFRQYLIFRIITVGLMMGSSLIYVIAKGYGVYKSFIVLIICMFRAVDALADVYEGWFQQKERLDLAGKAITYRIIVAILVFGGSLIFTRNLMISCMSLFLSYVICFCVFNIKYTLKVDRLKKRDKWEKNAMWFVKLVVEGLPLFLNAFLMMSIMNAPKMVIDASIANGQLEKGTQTVFNILFMPASVLTLAYIVFRPLLTKMAIMWNEGKISDFLKIIIKIIGCLLGMALLIMGGCAILGIPVLSLLYAIDLAKYRIDLLVIVMGGCFCTFSYVLDNALVVIRRQYLLIISYVFSWLYIKSVVGSLVKKWGVLGASISYATAMLVFCIVTLVIFVVCLKKDKIKQKKDKR